MQNWCNCKRSICNENIRLTLLNQNNYEVELKVRLGLKQGLNIILFCKFYLTQLKWIFLNSLQLQQLLCKFSCEEKDFVSVLSYWCFIRITSDNAVLNEWQQVFLKDRSLLICDLQECCHKEASSKCLHVSHPCYVECIGRSLSLLEDPCSGEL